MRNNYLVIFMALILIVYAQNMLGQEQELKAVVKVQDKVQKVIPRIPKEVTIMTVEGDPFVEVNKEDKNIDGGFFVDICEKLLNKAGVQKVNFVKTSKKKYRMTASETDGVLFRVNKLMTRYYYPRKSLYKDDIVWIYNKKKQDIGKLLKTRFVGKTIGLLRLYKRLKSRKTDRTKKRKLIDNHRGKIEYFTNLSFMYKAIATGYVDAGLGTVHALKILKKTKRGLFNLTHYPKKISTLSGYLCILKNKDKFKLLNQKLDVIKNIAYYDSMIEKIVDNY